MLSSTSSAKSSYSFCAVPSPFSISLTAKVKPRMRANHLNLKTLARCGFISMPVLGKIKAAGLTRSELAADIEQRLITGGHIKDPVVNIQFLNFKINVLGEVSRPGEFAINSDRVTLFDALSMAGDITDYGVKERITVIREQNGQRTIAYLDATSTEVFKSPYYYLQQNDIIIVDPNEIKQTNTSINQKGRNVLSTVTSLLSIAVTVTTLILTLTR